MAVTRRQSLAWAAAAAVSVACRPPWPTADPRSDQPEDLDALARRLVYGGVRADGIAPIDSPDYDPAGAAPLPATTLTPAVPVRDEDTVDAFVGADGRPRAYPRFVTVWHEIVNDVIAGTAVTLSYCPLTGSAVLFSGRLGDGTDTSFGTSGELLDSNLVMYDRASRSMWPQLLGTAVKGDRRGTQLREISGLVTTTYGRWRARYPTTLHLTTLTGSLRPYGTSPYGDYDRTDRIVFPVARRDERFHAKALFFGVRHGGAAAALAKERALRDRVLGFELGGDALVALADDELGTVRVFRRQVGAMTLDLRSVDGKVVDAQTASRWSPAGIAIDGKLTTERLEPVNTFEVFWFAWYAFHPRTAVLA